MKVSAVMMILFFTLFLLLVSILPVSADGIICNNQGVFTGASKGEVKSKCGPPQNISENTVKKTGSGVWKTGETWTYVIGGRYREFF